MVHGSVKPCAETMTERESLAAFCDGAKKAAYAARELAKELNDPNWINAAEMLEAMRDNGVRLSEMKSMTRLETLMAANIKSAKYNPN